MAHEPAHISTLQYLRQALHDEARALRELVIEQRILVLLLLAIIAGAVYFLKPFPPRHLSMAAGSSGDGYTLMAQTVSAYFRAHGVDLKIEQSTGSVENAELLVDDRDDVEIAFIQGGALTPEQAAKIYSLGSVSYEPVWIFYRRGAPGKHEFLTDLRGKRIGIGPERGGTRPMARELFGLNGIPIDGDDRFVVAPYEDNLQDFKDGNLDVLMVVAPYFDPEIQQLLLNPEFVLFDFRDAPAYAKSLQYIHQLTLPAFSVNIEKRIPERDVRLIATTTSIAVSKQLHPDIQTLLLMAARDEQRASQFLFFSKRGEFPSYVDPTIEASPVAMHFYDYGVPPGMRYLPFWMAGFIDRLWVLLLTLFAITYPLVRLNVHLRDLRFHIKHHRLYEELLAIERDVCETPRASDAAASFQRRLDILNRHAISDKVPVGMEASYFQLLNAIELLRNKARRLSS